MSVLLGICNWTHPLLRSPSCCVAVKDAGLRALQLAWGGEDFPLSSEDVRRQWKEEAARHGLRLDAVAVLDVMRWGMTAEAGSPGRAKAEEAIAAAVSGAAEMGIPRIILPSFKASAIRSRDDLRETARCLRLACALAKRRSMGVATENLLDTALLKTLFHIVGYDNLRLLLDLSNFTLRRRDEVFEALPGLVEMNDGAHVKDGLYGEPGIRPLGEGHARVGEQLAALKGAGYAGTLFLENSYVTENFGRDPWEAIHRDVAFIRHAEL